MAALTLQVGGRSYSIACRDGEEEHLIGLAAIVDRKTSDARSAVGDTSEARQLLLAALFLADELQEQAKAPATSQAPPQDDSVLNALDDLATRVEQLATRLENRG